jgi:aminoglycoside phosphotransferase (APT) family kinase protein
MDTFLQKLHQDGVVTTADARLIPLTGGVSSEIYRVEDGARTFVVKRALEKLRVAADWRADPRRNRFERLYLERVGQIIPGAVPRVLSANDGYFTMEWLGGDWENWKSRLLAGDCRTGDAASAGRILGRIHAGTAGDPELRREFDTTENFHQLRLDPYLMTAARNHPDFRPLIEAEIDRIAGTRECLVHGDYSPKNMLLLGDRLVVLDCEVAWYGDPAFDLAFLLNHLLLKALYHSPADKGLCALFTAARTAYFGERKHADEKAFDERTARVLLLLLLARVDGKSPVEYLPPDKQEKVRQFVLPQLGQSRASLTDIQTAWFQL